MKKSILFLLLTVMGIGSCWADYVDFNKAQKVSDAFVQSSFSPALRASSSMVLVTPQYYVFNVGSSGFVIVSSYDEFRPIIGYSFESNLDVDNIAPELSYFLDNMSENRQKMLDAKCLTRDAQLTMEWESLLSGNALPSQNRGVGAFYLCRTKWNQGDPYNILCPTGTGGRCYAGCVATAMSQVMRYWEYPTHGSGNHSYTSWDYGELSANFGEATYDYSKMPNSISFTSPEENIYEIAHLMYHCGIAVDMSYSPSGSGAYSEDVPDVILKYFGYSSRARLVYRDNTPLEEFQALLKNQFDMGWPCYYSGSDVSGNGGHAFVCDGYDENDMFHFNWGWSGSGDGFYAIDELNVSSYQFNSGQAFIMNFVPDYVFDNTAAAPTAFYAVPNGDEEFSVTLSWTNPTNTIDGHSIEAIDEIVIKRDGVAVKTFDNPTPGEAMTYVDPAGLPVLVNYTIHAVLNGYDGRKAHADGVNLGPTCTWTIVFGDDNEDWEGGHLTIRNSSGVEVADVAPIAERVNTYEVELPQGWVSFHWNAPETNPFMNFGILDSEGKIVFSFYDDCNKMPKGLFYEVVNTCGETGSFLHPTDLKTEIVGDDVVLTWTGIQNPGYGYNIYRDELFYTMVPDAVTYTDVAAANNDHCYYITAFCHEGETDPSNICCSAPDTEGKTPQNLQLEITSAGKAKLTWEKPEIMDGLKGYQVFRKPAGEPFKRVKNLGPNTTTYSDNTALADGNRYYYKVDCFYEEDFESSPARTLANPDLTCVEVNKTHIPSGLRIVNDNPVTLEWDEALLAESYNVYCLIDGNVTRIAQYLEDHTFVDAQEIASTATVYWVTGIYHLVESSPSNKACWGNVSIQETDGVTVMVYPNPSHGRVIVEAENIVSVSVFSVNGQEVMSQKGSDNSLNLDLSRLQAGVYTLKVVTSETVSSQTIILL